MAAAPMLAASPPAEEEGATVVTFDPTHAITEDNIPAGYTAIRSLDDFMKIKDTPGGKYVLVCDIDMTGAADWGSVSFSGDLDGNGYSVKNYTASHGLFNNITGSVENLYLENVNINSSAAYTGGLSNQCSGTITNCSVSGTVKSTSTATDNCGTGGLIGMTNRGTIKSCSSSVTVTGTSKPSSNTGGLVGYANNSSSITNSSASGSVTSTATETGLYSSAGGLVGGNDNSSRIENCSSSGYVTGISNYTGGLVGCNHYSEIINSHTTGSVTGTGNTGGLVGYNSAATIDNCYATGDVTGTFKTGGLVGWNTFSPVYIKNSFATGNVEGTDRVGGLVGENCWEAHIDNCYALGDVKGDSNIGGAVGTNGCGTYANINNTYSTGKVTGNTNVGGFVGNISEGNNQIANSYTTSDIDFYGNKTDYGSMDNCHGATDQPGVTGHEPEWFNDVNNVKSILGDKFDYSVIPPGIKGNERPVPPPPPPPPTAEGIQFQIGANSGEENTLKIDTTFSLNGFDIDASTREGANESIDKIDALLGEFSTMRSALGAAQNRLESVMDSLTVKNNNLSASHSTIVDTDFALESANLVRSQILENVTAALLTQANANPNIAMKLLE